MSRRANRRLTLEVWNNPYYHTQQDNFDNPDNLNFPYAVKMVRSVVGFVVDQAGVDVPVDALEFAYPDGRPEFVDPYGGTAVRVEVTGVGASVPQPGTGVLHYDTGGGWQSVAMEVVADNVYDAVFPAGDCGQEVFYYISAEDAGGATFTDPWNAPDNTYSALAAYGRITFFEDDFEIDQGWSVSGNAVDGQWQRAIPAGGGDRGDPPTDSDDSGKCYVTDNADGNSDVDDGYTYLTSPLIDLSERDAEVHYALWYTNNMGDDPNNDLFKTYISNNNGATWVLAETVGPMSTSGWTEHGFWVRDYLPPTAQMRVRFEASDLGSGSVVEAGIDAFRVFEYDCAPVNPGDLDGDGDVDAADLAILLGNWGPCTDEDPCPADFNGDGVVEAFDLAVLLGNWGP